MHLQQLLFAYRVKPHESAKEAPFFLLYGRDARLPTETALSRPQTPYATDVEDYRSLLAIGLTEAWKQAQQKIQKAQQKQKRCYDRRAQIRNFTIGDRVMVYMPHEAQGKRRKLGLALPWSFSRGGVDAELSNRMSVRPVDHPEKDPFLVNMDRVTRCADEFPDVSWTGSRKRRYRRNVKLRSQGCNESSRGTAHHGYNLRVTRGRV